MAQCVRRLFYMAALEGNSHTGLCFRYDVDNCSISLAHDTIPSWFQMGPLTTKTRQRYVHDGPIRYGNVSACCVVWRSVVNVSPQICVTDSQVSRTSRCCVRLSNYIERVERDGEHCIVYGCKDRVCYTRK
jgi:hypothetical protein